MGAHWRSCAGGALLVGLASGLNSPGQLHLASGAAVALRIDGAGNIATTAGASAGKYLILNYAGTPYKIALLNS